MGFMDWIRGGTKTIGGDASAQTTSATPAPASAPGDAAPAPRDAEPFEMVVDQAFTITGRGTVVIGTARGGSLRTGQHIVIERSGLAELRTTIAGLELQRRLVDSVPPDAQVGVLLGDVARTDVPAGSVLHGLA